MEQANEELKQNLDYIVEVKQAKQNERKLRCVRVNLEGELQLAWQGIVATHYLEREDLEVYTDKLLLLGRLLWIWDFRDTIDGLFQTLYGDDNLTEVKRRILLMLSRCCRLDTCRDDVQSAYTSIWKQIADSDDNCLRDAFESIEIGIGVNETRRAISRGETPPTWDQLRERPLVNSGAPNRQTRQVRRAQIDSSDQVDQSALDASIADNVFKKEGNTWTLRFRGGEPVRGMKDLKAAADIQFLLRNQNSEVQVQDLPGNRGSIDKEKAVPVANKADAEHLLLKMKQKRVELESEEDTLVQKELQDELDQLRQNFNSNFDNRAQPRMLDGHLVKMVKATKRRIKRYIDNMIFPKLPKLAAFKRFWNRESTVHANPSRRMAHRVTEK